MEYKFRILEVNSLMIKAYLEGDYVKSENYRILLNHYFDLALQEKRNETN